MSSELLRLRVIRAYPEGGLEVVAAEGPDLRMSLWEGPNPSRFPRHPCLGRSIATGRCKNERVWLESRPAGSLLLDLPPPRPGELAMLCAELCRALDALDKWGLAHGFIHASRVVVGGDGKPQLVGPRPSATSDLVQLRAFLLRHWPEGEAEPPLSADSAHALAEELDEWTRDHHPDQSPFRLGALSWEQATRPGPDAEVLEVEVDRAEEQAADEVSFDLGPDPAEPGLLDSWHSSSLSHWTETREWTMAGEGPERRRALVARLVSPPETSPDPDRFAGVEGIPCESIKRLVADEPLDPLPLPDGISPHVPPELEDEEVHTVVREWTRTATGTGARRTEEIPVAILRLATLALLGAVVALGSVLYRFFF